MGCCSSVDENVVSEGYQDKVNMCIMRDCELRVMQGSRINTNTQLANRRIELVCFGKFFLDHPECVSYVKYRDTAIPGHSHRPDLIINIGASIIHVEIDENNHAGYNNDTENARIDDIRAYCINKYSTYKLIRFNPHAYGKLETDEQRYNVASIFSNFLINNKYISSVITTDK